MGVLEPLAEGLIPGPNVCERGRAWLPASGMDVSGGVEGSVGESVGVLNGDPSTVASERDLGLPMPGS